MTRNTISDERIITYPNSALALSANVFVFFLLLLVVLLAAFVGRDILAVLIPIFLLIVLAAVSLNAYGKRIIFDRKTNKVIVKSLFSRKEYNLADIHSVSKVNATGAKDYYILTTKSDPFGQGVKLTNEVAFSNRELDEFEKNILPGIRAFIGQTPLASEKRADIAEKRASAFEKQESFAAVSAPLTTYRKNASGYYFYDVNALLIIIGAALFGWSAWAIYNFDVGNLNIFLQDPRYPTPLFKFLSPLFLLFSLVIFGRGVLRIRLRPQTHEFVKEYFFGAFKKSYKVKTPIECFVQSNRQNGWHTETDVHISVLGAKENSIVLRHFYKTKDVETFIAETKRIFGANRAN